MVAQSIGTKLVSVLGQLILAYYLFPRDYQLISLAFAVTALARAVESGGTREVLLYRGAELAKWRDAGFWYSLAMGLAASVAVVLMAPVAAQFYSESAIKGLATGIALLPITASLSTVPLADLQVHGRFRRLASITAVTGISQTVVTVASAMQGLGPWSFVLGALAAECLRFVLAWKSVKYRPSMRAAFALWPLIWRDTRPLIAVSLVTVLIQQIDYILLGVYHPEQLGFYFFAYGLASQTSQILGSQVSAVMTPILCSINQDPGRQLRGSLRAFQMLAAVVFPATFLQCALVDPVFRLLLPEKWLAAIPYTEILSLGLGINIISSLCWSVMKSQGRFNEVFRLTAVSALLFVAGVYVAASAGTAVTVAWCVVVLCAAYTPLVLWLSIEKLKGTPRDVWSVLSVPILASVWSFLISKLADSLMRLDSGASLARVILVASMFAANYVVALAVLRHPSLSLLRTVLRTGSLT